MNKDIYEKYKVINIKINMGLKHNLFNIFVIYIIWVMNTFIILIQNFPISIYHMQ